MLHLHSPVSTDPASTAGRFLGGTYAGPGGGLDYRLYHPRETPAAPPLFVMLHGASQSAADFAIGTRMNEVADEHGALVLYPEQSKSANFLGCWNWFDPRHQVADAGEPSLIANLTRHVMAEHAVDATRVYVAGMSAGGAMAVILGQTYPDLYAAVGVHSGLPSGVATDLASGLSAMNQGPRPAPVAQGPTRRKAIATIVFHGDNDSTVHVSNGEAVHAQALGRNAPAVVREPIGDCGGRSTSRFTRARRGDTPASELWIVHGAGHAWTGGDPRGSYTDPSGPDASREMTRFFLQQRLAVRGAPKVAA